MPELPTGTVTFLFTDIEGSTAIWEQQRDAMRQVLIRHDVLYHHALSPNARFCGQCGAKVVSIKERLPF